MQIKFKGKQRTLKCSQYALEVFTTNVDYERGQSISAVYATMYALLCAGSYARKEEIDFTFEEVCDWCDMNLKSKSLIDACNLWADSLAYKEFIKSASGRLGIEKKSQ